ncbi:MAG TPA: class I SAM-dependent methyltransferase [Candidatus Binatia bacterium]|nr:class I SAM-dependent methyltransferase [Candidatus Binatia bacterium]
MTEFALPRCDEPPDFRRQASTYSRYRRNYSRDLYDAIEERAGRGDGRRALDLACGPGIVAGTLHERGWRVTGVDFSRPMLEQARSDLGPAASLARGRSEALPLAGGRFGLLTCGTAFHWFAPAPALAEMARVLAPGGWAALFWRYPKPGEDTARVIRDVLARLGHDLPPDVLTMHPPEPFWRSSLEPLGELIFDVELRYTPESFHGYVATTEFLRRVAGNDHARFLADLREELDRRHSAGLVERCREHLFLARGSLPSP